jgi:hypothetical protein
MSLRGLSSGTQTPFRGAVPVLLALVFFAGKAMAYEHRQSTPSVGLQGGIGKLFGNQTFVATQWPDVQGTRTKTFQISDIAEWGPSVDINVRFVIDRNHALGFGFDDLRYRRKGGFTAAQADQLPQWVKFTTFHADYYLYFQRRMKISYYVAPFMGFQQQELRFKIGGQHSIVPTVESGEYRFLYGGTIGMEYFVGRSFSIDAGIRTFILTEKSGTSIAFQPALGFQVYVI